MTEVQPIEDSWTKWEYPTLVALATWEEGNQSREAIHRSQVVAMVGADETNAWKVGRALSRLADEGLITTIGGSDGTPWPMHVMGLTNAGLRRVGAWPTPASFQQEVVTQLNALADRIEHDQPEKAHKLRDLAVDVGSGLIAGAISKLWAKVTGMG